MPKAQVANRVTTALVACLRGWSAHVRFEVRGPGSRAASTCLEHLDEGDGEVEVGNVSANQTQAKHDTDGDDGAPEWPSKSVCRFPRPCFMHHTKLSSATTHM